MMNTYRQQMGRVVTFARSRQLSITVDPLNEKILAMRQACEESQHRDPALWWLTRDMIHCQCGRAWNRQSFPDDNELAEAAAPKVHCRKWKPWDDPTKYHGKLCWT